MAPAQSLTIVLPAFNEAERIGPALDELFGYLEHRNPVGRDGAPGAAALPESIEVLVVDDGSSDNTADLVRARSETTPNPEAGTTLRVLVVPHAGKGAAVRAGMLAAQSDLIIFADADMATPPDQLPLLVEALETHDVALGSRIQPDGSDMRASQPSYRRMLGKAFHFLASIWVVGPVKDTQCGFKGFRRDVAHDLFARQQITSIVFDVELIFLARKRGYSVAVIPIRWADKRGSRMRARFGLAIRVAWDLFRIPLVHRRVGRVAPARRMTGPDAAARFQVRKVLPFVAAGLGIVFLVLAWGAFQGSEGFAYDYAAYDAAARRLLASEPLYLPDTIAAYRAGAYEGLYLYPPPVALAFTPLALSRPVMPPTSGSPSG